MMRRRHVGLLWLAIVCAAGPISAGFAQGGSGKAQPGSKTPGAPKAEKAAGAEQAAESREPVVLHQVDPEDASLFSFDYGPPTSPASQLLGIDSGASPPSTSLTSFVLSIPNLLGDEQGQSIALDFAPAALFENPLEATFRNYVAPGNYLYRLAHRTRLTAAALNGRDGGADPAKAIRSGLAFGISASLLDSSDPIVTGRDSTGRSRLQRCLVPLVPQAAAILATQDLTPAGQRGQAGQYWLRQARRALERNDLAAARDSIRQYRELPAAAEGEGEDSAPARAVPGRPDATAQSGAPADAGAGRLAEARTLLATMEGNPSISEQQKQFMRLLLAEVEQLRTTASARSGRERPGDNNPAAAQAEAQPPAQAPGEMSAEQIATFVTQEFAKLEGETVQRNATASRAITTGFANSGLTARINLCAEVASRTARFSPDLDIGFGLVARGRPGALADIEMEGGAVWAAFRHPIHVVFPAETDREADQSLPTSALMIAASGRYGWNERLATGDQTMPEFQANTLGAWVGLEYLAPTFRLAGQYGWRRTYARSALGEPFETSGDRYLLQGQVQLGNERSPLWLDVSYGQATGTTDALSDETILVTLRYTPPKPPNIARSN